MTYAWRRLLASPAFTLTALVTLGVAIGANALIFSVVNGVLLKPLPFADPDRLVAVWHVAPGIVEGDLNQSPATYLAYRDEGVFQDIGLWANSAASVTGRGDPERVDALRVTDGTLPVVGVHPVLGRPFTAEDDAPGSAETVLLNHEYWQRTFGGREDAVGQTLLVDGTPRQIIGVLPEGFRFLRYNPAIVLPLRFDRSTVFVGNFSYQGVARLGPGGTMAQAAADIARIIPGIPDRFPMAPGFSREMYDGTGLGPNLRPLAQDLVGDVSRVLWILLGTVGLVLLVACANVANLFLVRAESRQQELAIRTALGASRGQVVRELLTEALTLAGAAGMLGVALAYGGVQVLAALEPSGLPRLEDITIDGRVMLFAVTLSILAGLVFGAIPMAKYSSPMLANTLKEGGRGSSDGRERHRARNGLVVAQVALALVLLVASGLMIRTFFAMRGVPPGFTDPDSVLTLRIAIPDTVVKDPLQAARTHELILQRIAALPGVASVAHSSSITMDGTRSGDPVWAEDTTAPEGQLPPLRRFKWISPGYFTTMGNIIVAGRDLSWDDLHQRRPVVLVSDRLARELWGSAPAAVGKRVRNSPRNMWREVVGVVGDERDNGVTTAADPTAYWPTVMDDFWDAPLFVQRHLGYVIRTPRVRTPGFIEEVQQAVWAVNPNLPIARVTTLADLYDRSMAQTSFALIVLGVAGGVALLLGLVGIYGVIAYIVEGRKREVGIRMAIGATSGQVQSLFLRRGLALTGVGLAVGLAAAAAVMRLLSTLLFGITSFDPVTYGVVTVSLAVVALIATWLPARHATRVDPSIALK